MAQTKEFLIVKNLLRKYNQIKSSVQFQYGESIIFDVDSDEYLSILSIDVILKRLLADNEITQVEFDIVNLFKDGYTYEEIGKIVNLSRQIVSKRLTATIEKIVDKFFTEEM